MMRPAGMGGERALRAAAHAVAGGLLDASRAGMRDGSRVVRVPSPPPGAAAAAVASPSAASAAAWGSKSFREEDWEDVGGEGGAGLEKERLLFQQHPPSIEEVEEAVSGLQQIYTPVAFGDVWSSINPFYLEHSKTPEADASPLSASRLSSPAISTESESGWAEPILNLYTYDSYEMSQPQNIFDALRLLQLNPAIQRMVVSLSSDRAVWDAVMNNEVVQEVKNSYKEGDGGKKGKESDDDLSVAGVVRKMLSSTGAKIMEIVAKIVKLVNELIHPEEKDQERSDFCRAVRSSLMLSVVVLLVVVATRVRKEF